MSGTPLLPNKITNITVYTDYAEVGVLTHGSVVLVAQYVQLSTSLPANTRKPTRITYYD
ncbi:MULTISPECIES: hypothetical protein [unclassified Pseudoalteromonas]|uniref:hypothetical protein n=1 Tax=unclassified Pseudoalteromonas TaxID=194690 RepID=UPI0018CF2AA9|nr:MULTISPECIES: hypothetical protein [unclassified Pseudoalteromonas]MBH0029623.1 hypothetical protein [Pseudoalteromonas sp. SWYJZ98]MDC9566560.1 hypothetical protein [Pseudoalteromonas sp. GAB2316C]MDC9570829.1 hypothetical protein [Pseudoalteromonas sp. GABNB9D]MDC9574853.1 hypothetical protein [Pseudoalteromonas sp. GABNS16A]MDC9579318.1 hypothetical protein [Pseudoalteromonas sp. GABNS16E]|tara:strand:- start:2888 stop:3064 length:177 start_codon:yes stop_codon:yes gene_type:complete